MPSRNPPAGNNVPAVPLYQYRARRYPWAQRVLAAAEAEHGEPEPTCTCGQPIAEWRVHAGRPCAACQPTLRPSREAAMHFLDHRDLPACRTDGQYTATTDPAAVTCKTCQRTTPYLEETGRRVMTGA